MAVNSSRYDMGRFGYEAYRPSPRQADLLIVSGTVTNKMALDYGITGPNLRASGLPLDLRKAKPYGILTALILMCQFEKTAIPLTCLLYGFWKWSSVFAL